MLNEKLPIFPPGVTQVQAFPSLQLEKNYKKNIYVFLENSLDFVGIWSFSVAYIHSVILNTFLTHVNADPRDFV